MGRPLSFMLLRRYMIGTLASVVDMPFNFCLPSIYLYRENRYLLFLTENYIALEILRHYLSDVVHFTPPDSAAIVSPGNEDSNEKLFGNMEPFILFGSSFPRDREYTQVCVEL